MPTDEIYDLVTLFIAIAALIVSVMGPLASAHVQLKSKRLEISAEAEKRHQELYENHRSEVVERYLTAAGKACMMHQPDNIAAFGSVAGEIYLYVDESLWPLVDKINAYLDNEGAESPIAELTKLCKALSRESKQSANHPKESNK